MNNCFSLAGFSRIFKHYKEGGAEDYICKSAYAFKQGEIDMSETLKYHISEELKPTFAVKV
jgi:hypothetical protein